MPFTVREIQPTPNPNALKFVLDRPIASQPTSFLSADMAADHPIGSKLFSIAGVTSVLLLGDFATINKRPDVKWPPLTEAVKQVLMSL